MVHISGLACCRTRKSGSKSDVTDALEMCCGWLMHGCASPPHHSICLQCRECLCFYRTYYSFPWREPRWSPLKPRR